MVERVLHQLLQGENELPAWELFHEASKTSTLDVPNSSEIIRRRMSAMWESFPYGGYSEINLPPAGRLEMPLGNAILERETARDICPTVISLDQLSTLLFHTYGETRDETESGFPRKFRAVPSGGAMYPLEVYLHSNCIGGIGSGIFHYNPCRYALRQIIKGDCTRELEAAFVQDRLARDASVVVFITSVSERSTLKYGERGYRFALLEAGHLAQNFVLAATALGLGTVPVGGYFDQAIDKLIGVDGLDQSTIYVLALGGRSGKNWLA